ncbi:hypothetical protein H4R20_003816, partial [Coemansia guatemalensis]
MSNQDKHSATSSPNKDGMGLNAEFVRMILEGMANNQDKMEARFLASQDRMSAEFRDSQDKMTAKLLESQDKMAAKFQESQDKMTTKLLESQERIAAVQNKTLERISNSQDALFRRIDNYISSKESPFAAPLGYSRNIEMNADNLTTPTKRGATSTSDSLVSQAISTPFVPYVRSSKNDTAHYIGLSKDYEHLFINVSMMMLLAQLGAEWMDAWKTADAAGMEAPDMSNIQDIFDTYEKDGDALCATSSGLESSYQKALCALISAVEDNLRSNGDGTIGVQWRDTHDSPMPNGRRPDGILKVGGPDVTAGWHNAVAIFELKSSRFDCTCSELRGQLLQGFTDMAEHQPRNHMLGFSISGAGEVHVYLCSQSEILYAKVGKLPVKEFLADDGAAVISFLLLVYT